MYIYICTHTSYIYVYLYLERHARLDGAVDEAGVLLPREDAGDDGLRHHARAQKVDDGGGEGVEAVWGWGGKGMGVGGGWW